MSVKISLSGLKDLVQEAYDTVKPQNGGANANYIPYLANVPSSLFGIALSLPSGEVIEVGDTNYAFGIESVSKVHTAILIMNQYSPAEIMKEIGADATGLPFNSIFAILLEKDHPSSPLVNAGAISACSMIKPVGDAKGKWQAIEEFFAKMCGSKLNVIDELYKSESATNFNNRAIAWLLKNYNRIYDEPDMSLDLYTRQCSQGVTARQLAISAGTIACGGTNPVTHEQVFAKSMAPQVVSLIATVGFYEHTGDWMYTSGIPAKTGVGGGIMSIMPGSFGLAAFSPQIDDAGNSYRAQLAIKYITNKLGVNVFGDSVLEVQ